MLRTRAMISDTSITSTFGAALTTASNVFLSLSGRWTAVM